VDGIILSEPIDEGQHVRPDTGVPIVSLGQAGDLPAERVALGRGRTAASCREAVEHLLDLGHERVWHVAGPLDWWEARERLEGWAEAHRARGIEPPPHLEGDWTPAGGYAAGLALPPEATAVFCANDDTAIGLARALHEAGRRVPEDVSLVGFDDIPAAAYLSPPLTTVQQDFEGDATHALDVLMRLLPGAAPEPEAKAAAPRRRLVVRSSTAPPLSQP
jgi:DNA-binding LacI/PurR family transcriptional regulator